MQVKAIKFSKLKSDKNSDSEKGSVKQEEYTTGYTKFGTINNINNDNNYPGKTTSSFFSNKE